MSYPALSVANYFLQLAERDGQILDPMKLQKLIYFAHGWNLAISKTPLIKEPVQAWRYGPVIPPVYHAFKKFGNGAITEPAMRPITMLQFNQVPYEIPDDEFIKELIDTVWKSYGKHSGIKLSNLTHLEGSPWQQVVAKFPPDQFPGAVVIPNELIKSEFEKSLNTAEPIQ